MSELAIAGLYAIADTQYLSESSLHNAVAQAIAGGARMVQYRDKTGATGTRLKQAQSLAALCRTQRLAFIVNDDVELAHALGAGVHLGRDDMRVAQARARLGRDALIGVSCYNEITRATEAQAQGCSYVAFGSFFPSPTKPGAVHVDVALLRSVRRMLHVPVVAIGGITPENGAGLIEAGADALAVIGGLFNAPDVTAAARRYAALFAKHEMR